MWLDGIFEIIETELNTIIVVPMIMADIFMSIPYFSFFMGLTLLIAIVAWLLKTGLFPGGGGGGTVGF